MNNGMDYGVLCTVDGTVAHCVLAAFAPSQSVRLSPVIRETLRSIAL